MYGIDPARMALVRLSWAMALLSLSILRISETREVQIHLWRDCDHQDPAERARFGGCVMNSGSVFQYRYSTPAYRYDGPRLCCTDVNIKSLEQGPLILVVFSALNGPTLASTAIRARFPARLSSQERPCRMIKLYWAPQA